MISNPADWTTALATSALAIESGKGMLGTVKKDAASAAPTIVVNGGITATEYFIGIAILALVILGAAMIVHHGLTA